MGKKNIIVNLVFVVVFLIILFITNFTSSYAVSSNIEDCENIINKFNIDYVVDDASKEQQAQLEINSDYSVYSSKIALYYNNTIGYKETLLFKSEEDLYSSCYKENLIIKKSNNDNMENKIYINQRTATNYNLQINDKIEYTLYNQSFTGTIYAIYSNLLNSDELFALTLNNELNEFGIYKQSIGYYDIKDNADIKNFIDDYKPEGLLKSRIDFNSDSEYESHLQWYKAQESKNYISNFETLNDKINSDISSLTIDYKSSITLNVVISAIVFLFYYLISFVCRILINKNRIKNGVDTKRLFMKTENIRCGLIIAISFVLTVLACLILSQYYRTAINLFIGLSVFIAIFIVTVLFTIIERVYINYI